MEDKNPFKKLEMNMKDPPLDLKRRVMDGIEGIKLVNDIATLFTLNLAETTTSILKTKKKK